MAGRPKKYKTLEEKKEAYRKYSLEYQKNNYNYKSEGLRLKYSYGEKREKVIEIISATPSKSLLKTRRHYLDSRKRGNSTSKIHKGYDDTTSITFILSVLYKELNKRGEI